MKTETKSLGVHETKDRKQAMWRSLEMDEPAIAFTASRGVLDLHNLNNRESLPLIKKRHPNIQYRPGRAPDIHLWRCTGTLNRIPQPRLMPGLFAFTRERKVYFIWREAMTVYRVFVDQELASNCCLGPLASCLEMQDYQALNGLISRALMGRYSLDPSMQNGQLFPQEVYFILKPIRLTREPKAGENVAA